MWDKCRLVTWLLPHHDDTCILIMTPQVMMHPHPAHRETWLPDASNVLGFLRKQFLASLFISESFYHLLSVNSNIVIICIISLYGCLHNRHSSIQG